MELGFGHQREYNVSPIHEILNVPWPLVEYQAWLQKEPLAPVDDYLFARSRIRFEPAGGDRLTLLESAEAVEQNGRVCVRLSKQLPHVDVPSLTLSTVKALFDALRKRPLLVELPFAARVPQRDCDQLLRVGFGRFVFAPEPLAALERQTAASEVVRFPASPYEIVRNYWHNAGQLSTEISADLGTVDESSFENWLRECHVKLLLGPNFDTFYRPSSPIARSRVMPGALYTRQTQVVTASSGAYIVEGPRINASPVGGEIYHRLLQSSLQEGAAKLPLVNVATESDWGSVITARARGDERVADWFVPPRPIGAHHLDFLRMAWNRAITARNEHDTETSIGELGKFHWCFVRLHPFACANQSLAFTLVNCVLRQVVGCGIPQLILDQMALRLTCSEYIRVFSRAVDAWRTDAANGLERQKDRIHKRQQLDRGIAAIASAKTVEEAETLTREDPAVRRLALLESVA